MSLIFILSSGVLPPHINQLNVCDPKIRRKFPPNQKFAFISCKIPWRIPYILKNNPQNLETNAFTTLKFTSRASMNPDYNSFGKENTVYLDWTDQDPYSEDLDSPWEGAVLYKRNPSVSHVEYCTTLERLGLGEISTKVSKSRASMMGIRVTKAVKDYPLGTPVQISIDVTRKKHKLRLDGIIKTVITLDCNRCCQLAAQSVFSNFSLLLTGEPVEEPEVIDMGVIFGEDNSKTCTGGGEEEDEDDDASIDWDDRFYFPPEEREIDISKPIRDLIHVEININAVCDPMCKGICLNCGVNLNTSNCNCGKTEVKEKTNGPLGNLRKQMQQK